MLITQYYPPEIGAAAVRLQAMVDELVRRGHEVDVVTALPNYPHGRIFDGYRGTPYRQERRGGATVHRVWVHAATGSGVGRALNLATFAGLSVLGTARARRPDVVLVESPPLMAAVPALVNRLVRRRPIVLLLADLWPDTAVELGLLSPDGWVTRLLYRLEALLYRSCWKISPVTVGQIDTLQAIKRVPAEKIAFLPNGVDTEMFRPSTAAERSAGASATRDILFAGTLGYAQGLDVLLDAAPLVRRRHPDARFLLVGGGSERGRLVERVRTEGIEGVEFREPMPIEDVAPLFRTCYAGFTSLRRSPVLEGARPSKIFPIMASGRPVVYSGAGEGADLVAARRAGVVAPPGDVEALAGILDALLDDPDGADEMGRCGRAFVESELSWSRLIDDWLTALGEPAADAGREVAVVRG